MCCVFNSQNEIASGVVDTVVLAVQVALLAETLQVAPTTPVDT